VGDLTERLSRHEFACKCGCGFDTVDITMAKTLELAADHFQTELKCGRVKIIITSGCRCKKHNRSIGGAADSQHLFGRAADHKLYVVELGRESQINPDLVAQFYEDIDAPGVGWYRGRTHVDTRSNGPARWDER
jgi:uncharacterized protein YcbK (DUF882 family)